MKFDMGQAWTTATGLLSKNKDVILVVAGVFFFLPYLASSLLMPQAMTPQPANPEDMQAVLDTLTQTYADFWWVMLVIFVTQGVGTLALLVLLTDRARPTLGDALKRGALAFLSYFATNILSVLIIAIAVFVPIFLAISAGVAAIGVLVLPIVFYLMVKFSLIMPAIAIDGIRNPLSAIARSWQLTKGNSFRLFVFYFLLFIATIVVFLLVSLVLGVVFAAMGGQIEIVGNGIVASLINAVFVVVFLAVLAGIHRQLSGDRPEELSDVFD